MAEDDTQNHSDITLYTVHFIRTEQFREMRPQEFTNSITEMTSIHICLGDRIAVLFREPSERIRSTIHQDANERMVFGIVGGNCFTGAALAHI